MNNLNKNNMTAIEQILDALGDHFNKYIIEVQHEQWCIIDDESGNGEPLRDFLERVLNQKTASQG